MVDENYNLRGLITIKDIQKSAKYPNSARDARGRLLCGAAVGVTARHHGSRGRAGERAGGRASCLDTAHGHSEGVLKMVEQHPRGLSRADRSSPATWPPPRPPRPSFDAGADVRQGRHRPRLHLHHPRGRGHRRAADHGHHGLRRGGGQAGQDRSSPTAASSTPATSPRPSRRARAPS